MSGISGTQVLRDGRYKSGVQPTDCLSDCEWGVGALRAGEREFSLQRQRQQNHQYRSMLYDLHRM